MNIDNTIGNWQWIKQKSLWTKPNLFISNQCDLKCKGEIMNVEIIEYCKLIFNNEKGIPKDDRYYRSVRRR